MIFLIHENLANRKVNLKKFCSKITTHSVLPKLEWAPHSKVQSGKIRRIFFFFIEMLRSVKLVQGLEATASRCSLSTELWLIYIYLFRNFSPSHRYRHSPVHHFSLPLLFLPQAGEVFLASWWGRFRIHRSRHQATRDRWLRWRNQRSGAECDWFHIESAAERPRHGWSGEIDTEQRCLVVTWAGLVCWDRWD